MRRNNRLKVLFFIIAAIALTLTIVYIVLEITGVLVNNRSVAILFAILVPFNYAGGCSALVYLLIQKNSEKSLRLENQYNLGKDSTFYNYYEFQRRLKLLYLINGRRKESYIISLSATKQSVMRNMSRNDIITQYNGYISDFMHDYLNVKTPFNKNDFCYCYYHGAFLIYCFGDEEKVRTVIREIEKNMYEIVKDKDLKVYVQPFFGVAKVDPEDSLIVSVDHAMTARNNSEQRFEGISFYSKSIDRTINLTEVDEIKAGLESNEFVVYYQPKFDLNTKEFCGAEALVRWKTRTRGILPPSKFLETAEASGLISNIDDYVFEKVCQDLEISRKKGRRTLPVSINFIASEFYDTNFVNHIVETVDKYRIPHNLIEIEITENASRVNNFLSETIVELLGKRGFKVLMDDFGIGYSNLANLINMKFHVIKIDKSYIDKIQEDKKTRDLLRFLVNLAKSNELEVIAEGVDTEEQVDFLKKIKCDVIQGYYYSQPLPKAEYDKFLLENPFEKRKRGE